MRGGLLGLQAEYLQLEDAPDCQQRWIEFLKYHHSWFEGDSQEGPTQQQVQQWLQGQAAPPTQLRPSPFVGITMPQAAPQQLPNELIDVPTLPLQPRPPRSASLSLQTEEEASLGLEHSLLDPSLPSEMQQ